MGSAGPGLRHGAVKADARTGRQDQARGLRAAAIRSWRSARKTPRASSGSQSATARAPRVRSRRRGARPSLVSCCGHSRCMVSAAIASTSCRGSACILRRRWCVSANGASSTGRPGRSHCRRRKLRRNTASKRRRIRPVPRSTWSWCCGTRRAASAFGAKASGSALDNWFETQQRIIRRIATSLNVQLSAERLKRLAGEPDVSLDVYDRWLRGQNLMAKFDSESWQRAVTIFRDAIRDDPAFSPCYSSLVQMNNVEHFVHPGVLSRPRQGERNPRTCKKGCSAGSGRFPGRISAAAGPM